MVKDFTPEPGWLDRSLANAQERIEERPDHLKPEGFESQRSEELAHHVYETWARVAAEKGFEVTTPPWAQLPPMYRELCVSVTEALRAEGVFVAQD